MSLTLAIDVGTGSVRAGLVDTTGRIVALASKEHEQIVPRFGWSEQRPADWWAGTVETIRRVLDAPERAGRSIACVSAGGQMHGTVLIDADGALTRETVPLWNDKRTADHVRAFEAANPPQSTLAEAGNPATPAWPAFKLQWLRDNDPEAYARTAAVLMPKDFINLKLTGAVAMDTTEAAASFLVAAGDNEWSLAQCDRLGLDHRKLAPIRRPVDIVGRVTAAAAAETGLPAGTPVLVGAGDYPLALLGSGACRPGVGSDVGGTSNIVTVYADRPLLHPEVSNVGTPDGGFGAFMLLDSGGDAVRWARRAFHERTLSYEQLAAKAAAAPAGSSGLFFLPYLSGERLGESRAARAQFFGLAAQHGLAELHRSILEGVAFASCRQLRIMEANAGLRLSTIIASGGGARHDLWMRIKASVYGATMLVPEEAECSLVGSGILGAVASGAHPDIAAAVNAAVRYIGEITPDPDWVARYQPMQAFHDKLYRHSQALYADLDALGG